MADVTVVIGVDNKGAITGMKQVSGAATEIEKNSTKAGSALGDMAKIAGGFVLAQGLMKLPGLLSGFIGGASDLSESLSKVRTVFGENAKEIEAWAGTAAKSLGMSKGAALEAAGTFGNFLQAMGATSPAATKMSKDMVQLATDLGSFNNADPTEVLLALRSGLSGEAEPLRKFGVAISDAAVKAKALQLGLGGVGKELTEQEKIQARYAIIMEQTTMAQGDFARTSDGLANQTKILKAMFKDAGDQLGTALLPGIVAVMGAVIQVTPWVISLAKDGFEKLKEVTEPLVGPLETIAGLAWDGLKDLAALAWDALKDGANALAGLVGAAWDKIDGPLTALKDIAWQAIKDGSEALGKLAGLAWEGVEKAVKAIAEFAGSEVLPRIEAAAKAIGDIAETNLGPLITQIQDLTVKLKESGSESNNWAAAWTKVTAALKPAGDILGPIVKDILRNLSETLPIVADGTRSLAGAFKDLWEAVKPLHPILEPLGKLIGGALVLALASLLLRMNDVVVTINTTLKVAFELMSKYIGKVAEDIDEVTKVVQEWGPKIGFALGTVAKVFESNIQIIVGFFDRIGLVSLYEIGKSIIAGLASGIWDAATGVLSDTLGKVKDLIPLKKGPPSEDAVLLYPAGRLIIGGLAKGMEDEFTENVLPALQTYARDIFETINTDALAGLYDNVPGYVNKKPKGALFGTPSEFAFDKYMPQYEGGGQTGYLGGGVGPNGTVWDEDAKAYVMPWEVGNNLTGRIKDWQNSDSYGYINQGTPLVINVGTMNVRDASDARQAAGDLRYAMAAAGMG